jgi:hypothetical protein
MAVEQNLHELFTDKPEVVQALLKLNEAHVRWALYAGSETALLAANRVPTDIDIIVHDDDFDEVARLLPTLRRYDNQPEDVIAGEGQKVGFICSGVVGQLGGTDVDIMSEASFKVGGKEFPIRLTDYAAEHRLDYYYDTTHIYLANPFDTILIKAFMRRGAEQNKFDKPDAEALVSAVEIDPDYKAQRLQEVGAPEEVRQFLQEVGA